MLLVEYDNDAGVFLSNPEPERFHVHTIVREPNGNDYGKGPPRAALRGAPRTRGRKLGFLPVRGYVHRHGRRLGQPLRAGSSAGAPAAGAGVCRRSLRETTVVMGFLVTSASGANGTGYGAILSFGPGGELTGPFSADPRIADPRGLSLDPSGALVYVNSGDDRVLALDLHGNVVRDSGRIPGLDPGGAEFGPDGRYYVTMRRQRTILAMPVALDGAGEFLLPEGIVPFPRGFGFGPGGRLYLSSGAAPSGPGDNTIVVFDRPERCTRRTWSPTPN